MDTAADREVEIQVAFGEVEHDITNRKKWGDLTKKIIKHAAVMDTMTPAYEHTLQRLVGTSLGAADDDGFKLAQAAILAHIKPTPVVTKVIGCIVNEIDLLKEVVFQPTSGKTGSLFRMEANIKKIEFSSRAVGLRYNVRKKLALLLKKELA